MDFRRRLKRIEKELYIGKRPKSHVLVLGAVWPELPKYIKAAVIALIQTHITEKK